MCGIFGYIGKRTDAGAVIFAGLRKLEYRGYDSWGIACYNGNKLEVQKAVGKIGNAKIAFSTSSLGLGQTRWATHGGVTKVNAHPHFDCHKRIALVHNGIVENYQEIRNRYRWKHRVISQTDTEIIAHLIEEELQRSIGIEGAVRKSFLKLKGLNALVVLDTKESKLLAVKRGSPLVLGLSIGEYLIASDSQGLTELSGGAIFLEDDQLAVLASDKLKVLDVKSGKEITPQIHKYSKISKDAVLGKYKHYLIKEVYEQPKVLKNIIKNSGVSVSYLSDLIKGSFGTYLVGCGTASYAALSGTYFFSRVAKYHVNFSIGSEFNYLLDFITNRSLVIGVSQSGETMDIIESVTAAKNRGAKIGSLVNSPGSTLFRLSDYKIDIAAGQERAVISTKAFTAQVALLLYTAYIMANRPLDGVRVLKDSVRSLASILKKETQKTIYKLAKILAKNDHVYIIGRGVSYPAALECALKIKEASYIHAEGFAGGELKHGVIALVGKRTPCIVLAPGDETYGATMAAAMEVKARGGFIIGLSFKDNEVFDYFIKVPGCGVGSIIPNVAVCQTLAYYLTLIKRLDPDKPRNLAKSVTVR